MTKKGKSAQRSGLSAVLLFAGAALLVGAPSAVLAVGALNKTGTSIVAPSNFANFTPASVDPRLARMVADRTMGKGGLIRFTPAGAANNPGRSVTVAVRIDEDAARAISVHQALSAAEDSQSSMAVRISPTRYNLGLLRGYQGFARPPEISSKLAKNLSEAEIPDLAAFQPSEGAQDKPSRFSARIALEESEKTGRSPRTREALGDQTVDVGGSYSLTRNLNVTAGVRYSQDRDRLAPVSIGKQDSQAVYVGTQFSF